MPKRVPSDPLTPPDGPDQQHLSAENRLPGQRFSEDCASGPPQPGPDPDPDPDPNGPTADNRLPGQRVLDSRAAGDRYRAQIAEIAELVARMLPRWELAAGYRLRAIADRHLLSEHELTVVAELLLRRNPLAGATIAGIVGLSTGGVTRLLARLEDRELVERFEDPHDRRRILARATPEARDLLWDDLVPDARHLLNGLGTEHARRVPDFLRRASDDSFRQAQTLRDRAARDWRRQPD